MNEYLGTIVDVEIDRPLGSRHPKHDFFYPINYGYIPNTLAPDGEEIDAYVLGEFEPIKKFRGRVIAVIKRKNDNEDKLVVAKTLNSYSKSDIEVLTEFQERFFDTEIICCGSRKTKPYIRVTTLGLARRQDEILVTEGVDALADTHFYRFPGGGVEFWETSEEALKREFMEELNAEILSANYLCKIENIFEFEGEKKHEIILIYEVKLPNEYYEKEEMILNENGAIGKALWIDKHEFLNEEKILYPTEIKKWL
ncbi:NUDIX domain-containing protein [Iocasia frigidifontis]|uniref:inorganic diphosphatase n=1 Tax=Iocasia fonsfrigidae TaxID=2682810 RepID=A0A8A7KEV2_9FIRM|nr:inorganic diphosphatase [Iocasia fonsfrigidae]QTL98615.1 NUDIX domain-containing protein [Iocasia fonsfrigidae]